jgi:hypothetical protein
LYNPVGIALGVSCISEQSRVFSLQRIPPSGIICRGIASPFFVISGVRDGRIWYNRCNRAPGAMNCVLMNYRAGDKRKWDAIVTRISRSLR